MTKCKCKCRNNIVRTFPLEILQSTRRSWGMLFLCYSIGMDHLVHTFIDTVTLFLSQNDQLNFNQSGFNSGRSTETALLSVTVALQIEKADSKSSVLFFLLSTIFIFIFIFFTHKKSSVLILLDPSATFDMVNHQIILSTITGSALHWFEYYLTGRSFRVSWEERYPKNINWPQSFLRDQFLDHWWHTALSFISTRQSNSSCMDLRLPGKHLGMDEGTSPAAQPGKDWASRFPCQSDSTAWFHHPARVIKKYSLVTSWPSRTIL